MKNVIYQIRVGNLPGVNHLYPLCERYANKIGADLVVYNDEAFQPKNYPSPNFLIFDILKDFIKSEYENMLYVDADIRIMDNADNIFENFKEMGMVQDIKAETWRKEEFQKWLDNYFSGVKCNQFFNGGVMVANKNSIESIINILPDDVVDFWKSHPDEKLRGQNQTILNYFISKSGVNCENMDERWNKCCRDPYDRFGSRKSKNGEYHGPAYFIHYVSNKHQIQTDLDKYKDNMYNPNIKMTL